MPKLYNAQSNPFLARAKEQPDEQVALQTETRALARDSIASYATLKSMEVYQQFAQDRKNQLTDENGILMADTLSKDLNEFGQNLILEHGNNIEDKEARAAYQKKMSKYLTEQQASNFDDYFDQVDAYAEQTLNTIIDGVNKLSKIDDPENYQVNIDAVDSYIGEMAAHGAIADDMAEDLSYHAEQQIRANRIRRMLDDGDIDRAAATLQEDTMLNEHLFENLTALAATRSDSVERRNTKAEIKQDSYENGMTQLMLQEIELGVKQGQLDDYAIEDMMFAGIVSDDQGFELLKLHRDIEAKNAVKLARQHEITNKLVQGQPLTGVSNKELNDHYLETLNVLGIDQETGERTPLSIADKARVANNYRRPVKAFQEELGYMLTNPGEMGPEALEAYELTLERNPTILEGMDKNARTVATKALRAVNFAGADPSQALRDATDFVYKTDPETKKAYADVFDNLEEFRPRNLAKTIKNDLDADGKKLAPGVSATYHQMLKDEFIRSGNLDDARAAVKAQIDPYLGPTEFNEESGIFDDTEQIMFFPPEKMFPGVEIDTMKSQLLYDLQQAGVAPPGANAKGLRIVSDNLSRQEGQPLSYAVSLVIETDEGPVEVLVQDENGEHLRWVPDYEELKAVQKQLDDE